MTNFLTSLNMPDMSIILHNVYKQTVILALCSRLISLELPRELPILAFGFVLQ